MKHFHKIGWILVLLVAVVSCIKCIYEPDIWWQIATGNWILENGQVPTTDMFSYTYENEPWINVKWGAEVLMSLLSRMFGVEFLPILQIICLLGILFFIKKLYFQFLENNYKEVSRKKILGLVYASILALFIVNFRLNSRPEMFSHLFSIAMLFLIVNHKKNNSKFIFLLIPLQIIWTNMHEAYGVGMIVMITFLISFWIEWLYLKPKYEIGISFKPIKYTISSIVAILAISINPYGFKMILHPFNILEQLNLNKYTYELISIGTEGYMKFQSVLMLLIVVILFFSLFKKTKVPRLLNPIKQLGLGYCIVLCSFLYLSLTSFRNIPFFIFVATPVLGCVIFAKEQTIKKPKIYYQICILATVLLYISLTTNYYYKTLSPKNLNEEYGLKVNSKQTPIGAANFIKENDLKGKSFVDYLSSSYFMYEVPGYKSYIDLRDLDIFELNFFDNTFAVYRNPTGIYQGQTLWNFIDSVDKFNYVVLLNSDNFQNLNLHLFHEVDNFVLVYADLLNSVYIRNSIENKKIIEKFGYQKGRINFNKTTELQTNNLSSLIPSILWPLYFTETSLNKNIRADYNVYCNYMQIK